MKDLFVALFGVILIGTVIGTSSDTAKPLLGAPTAGSNYVANTLKLPSLLSKDCLGTDASGIVQAGTCGGGFSTSTNDYWLGTVSKGYFWSTTSADYWETQQAARGGGASGWATTSSDYWLTQKSTSNLAEGTNLYYTNARVLSYLDTLSKGYFFSTTSADAWGLVKGYITDGNTNWDNTYSFITGAQVPANETDAAHDTCAEISGCVVGAITDGNTGWDNSYNLFDKDTDTTANLAENTNLFFTNARADARINATSTIGTITSLPNLATVGTIGTGVWQGTAIGDAYLTKTGNWTGTFDGQEGTYYLNYANLTNKPTNFSDDDLTNNSIEDLNDVAAMTETWGDLLFWNGSAWADKATSTLGIAWSDLVGIPAGFADGTDDTGGGGVTGGTSGMLAAWTGASTLTATGTPTFASFTSTSTAISTMRGPLSLTAGANMGGNNIGEGLISAYIPDTYTGSVLSLHSSSTAAAGDGELLHIEQYNANHANEILKIENSSTQGGSEEIAIISNVPDVMMCDNTDSANDCFEIEVTNHGELVFNSRNSADTAFERSIQLSPYRTGGMLALGAQFDAAFLSAKLTIVGSSTLDHLDINSIGNTTASGDVFTVKNNGNVGIGTTSPYAKLSVVGPAVAQYFHATDTTATTTLQRTSISGAVSILGEYFTNFTTYVRSIIASASLVVTGAWDFGGATSVELPNGTNPTVDAAGEIALDTTDNQVIWADSGNAAFVLGMKTVRIVSFALASSSPSFVSGAAKSIPVEMDGYTVSNIRCFVEGGTSKAITLFGETITCTTSVTSDDGTITSPTSAAAAINNVTMGATTGAVNYVNISIFGRWTRE